MEPTTLARCELIHSHDHEEPREYVSWHVWAQQMTVTHTQHRCPVCSRYKIWLPRKVADGAILSEMA